MVTNNIKNIFQNAGNFDAIITPTQSQVDFIKKSVLLDGKVKGCIIPDETEILYVKNAPEPTDYIDKNKNEGYQYIYEYEAEEFAGEIETVALASRAFKDPKYNSSYFNFREEATAQGTGTFIFENADEVFTGKEKTLDVNFVEGTITLFDYDYVDENFILTLKRYNHDFHGLRIGKTSGFVYLNEVLSVDLSDLFKFEGKTINKNTPANVYYGKDEKSKKYVIAIELKANNGENVLFNTAIIDVENIENVEIHQMMLPNEIKQVSFMRFKGLGGDAVPACFYKGRFCNLYHITRTAEEAEISEDKMISINYKNSTDIKEIETKWIYQGKEIEKPNSSTSCYPSIPVIDYTDSFISANWTIKNDVAYVKESGINFGFYRDGYVFTPNIFISNGKPNYTFTYYACPFDLSIVETPTNPLIKTLNKTLKITFRIVNTGGLSL